MPATPRVPGELLPLPPSLRASHWAAPQLSDAGTEPHQCAEFPGGPQIADLLPQPPTVLGSPACVTAPWLGAGSPMFSKLPGLILGLQRCALQWVLSTEPLAVLTHHWLFFTERSVWWPGLPAGDPWVTTPPLLLRPQAGETDAHTGPAQSHIPRGLGCARRGANRITGRQTQSSEPR